MSEGWRDVKLPADLCAAIEREWGATFATLEDFLVFVMKELGAVESAGMDEAEERLVEERLRALGYVE